MADGNDTHSNNSCENTKNEECRTIDESQNQAKGDTGYKDSFECIKAEERAWIDKSRCQAKLTDLEKEKDLIGLALSGGGIRSATFCLGFLQALERYKWLKHIDILSTVSGGGYIGSALTWFLSRKREFPFSRKQSDETKRPAPHSVPVVDWIRQHASFLTEGPRLSIATLVVAALRGMIANLLFFIPLLMLVVMVLGARGSIGFYLLRGLGYASLLCCLLGSLMSLMQFRPGFSLPFGRRKNLDRSLGDFLSFGIALCIVGSIPFAYAGLKSLGFDGLLGEDGKISALFASSAFATAVGWLRRGKADQRRPVVRVLIQLGIVGLFYSVTLGLFHLQEKFPKENHLAWAGLVGVPIFIGLFVNINRMSVFRYYRDRLAEAFMPNKKSLVDPFKEEDWKFFTESMGFSLGDLTDKGGLPLENETGDARLPFHIVNARLSTPDSDDRKLRHRQGGNFIFSPLYCGSEHTGYVRTKDFTSVPLSSAMAVSGAAVDPNFGHTPNRLLGFLMAFLNIRLGLWIKNPATYKSMSCWKRVGRFLRRALYGVNRYILILRELPFLSMCEKGQFIRLSDGGHFENLGLYELLRRKCEVIIVCDAGADPDFEFADLGRVVELARVDFSVSIEIDTRKLRPEGENEIAERPVVYGTINYDDNTTGALIYVKTTVFGGLPEDIYAYKRSNKKFPDQTTADQFFDERQFEAYRELGYRSGQFVCTECRCLSSLSGLR